MKALGKIFRWLIDHFDLLVIGVTAVICLVITVLDFLDRLDVNEKIIPNLTLMLVSGIAIYLLIERRKHLEAAQKEITQSLKGIAEQLAVAKQEVTGGFSSLEQGRAEFTNHLIDSINGTQVLTFADEMACVEYATKRILEAEKEIDDTSWAPKLGFTAGRDKDLRVGNEHWDAVVKSLDEKKKLVYREILVFNDISRLEKLIVRFNQNRPGYYCVYYDKPSTPLIQFMIIDDIEVIFMTDQYPTYLAVRNKAIAALFKEYYDDLWKRARPIKLERNFSAEIVEEIQNKYGKALGWPSQT